MLKPATIQKDHARNTSTPFSSQPLECFNCTQGVWSSAWVMQRMIKDHDKESTENNQIQNILSKVKICDYPAKSLDAQIRMHRSVMCKENLWLNSIFIFQWKNTTCF